MPAIHSASISTKMLQELGGGNLVGPYLVGFKESIQIAPLGANVSDIVNLAALAAFKNQSFKKFEISLIAFFDSGKNPKICQT